MTGRELHLYRIGSLIRIVSHKLFAWTPAAITVGFTRIYWAPPTEETRLHEAAHVRQAQGMGRVRFWLSYLNETRKHGYYLNQYEVDARDIAAAEVALNDQRSISWEDFKAGKR